jgi:hypothetical protein
MILDGAPDTFCAFLRPIASVALGYAFFAPKIRRKVFSVPSAPSCKINAESVATLSRSGYLFGLKP